MQLPTNEVELQRRMDSQHTQQPCFKLIGCGATTLQLWVDLRGHGDTGLV
jgi:hypothetical protein